MGKPAKRSLTPLGIWWKLEILKVPTKRSDRRPVLEVMSANVSQEDREKEEIPTNESVTERGGSQAYDNSGQSWNMDMTEHEATKVDKEWTQ